ncbi:hypothetical protein ZWY2020_040450, partial [Hordeum vulgare]
AVLPRPLASQPSQEAATSAAAKPSLWRARPRCLDHVRLPSPWNRQDRRVPILPRHPRRPQTSTEPWTTTIGEDSSFLFVMCTLYIDVLNIGTLMTNGCINKISNIQNRRGERGHAPALHHSRETQGLQLTPLDQPQKSYISKDTSKTRQQQNITDSRLRNISTPPNQICTASPTSTASASSPSIPSAASSSTPSSTSSPAGTTSSSRNAILKHETKFKHIYKIRCISLHKLQENAHFFIMVVARHASAYSKEQNGLQQNRITDVTNFLSMACALVIVRLLIALDFPPLVLLFLSRLLIINDRYEFPLQLDLDRDDGKYLAPDADRSIRNLYTLHSVLVHSGGVHGGHYYAFIRPTLANQWYKFDDERVTKEDTEKAFEEQYGGVEELPQINPGFNNTPFKFTKYSNAYMLVYIRESDTEKIMCNVDEKDIAEHLRIRLKKEREEKEHKKKEKAEAHLYTIIKIARDEDLKEQTGKDIYFDLVDHEKVRSFRIQKQLPFSTFKEEVAKEYGIPVQFQRFWLWAKRQNHTYRPNRPLNPHEETQSVGQLREISNKAQNAELKLFLEVEFGLDLQPLPPPEKSKEDILLFFKLYNPEKEVLCFVGRLFVKALGKPSDILRKLTEMAGFTPDEEIELYEEIKFEPNVMCEHIDKKLTFRASQLEDGDIVCFQKSPKADSGTQVRYPDVPSFLEYVHNRQVVHFRSLEKPKDIEFCLELSKLHTYDDVVERVARQLGLDDPAKIRLTSHNCYSQQPKPQHIRYQGVEHLLEMLIHYNQTSDILYYEVLDIPLPELQFLKTLKVVIHSIRLSKNSTIADVIIDLKTKVDLSSPTAELRVLEVFYHKIYKIFPLHEKIENINDQYWTLRAEEVPEEERNPSQDDRLIHVYHFVKDPLQNQIQNFGDPFFLAIHEGETLAEVKGRIQRKLQVPDEEFSKWKFAFISMNRPDYLQDSDVVSACFQRRDVYGAWEQYLGLEHTDTAPKRAYTANQSFPCY